MRTYVDVATLTGSKSLDGRLVAKAGAGLPFLLREGMEVWLVPPVIDAPRFCVVSKASDVGGKFTVAFEEVSDSATADMLLGCHCLVDKQDVADIEGYIDVDAMSGIYDGWRFIDDNSGCDGVIQGVDDVAGQRLLRVILKDEDIHLVPLVEDFLVNVDDDARTVFMKCPTGLFDL